MTFVRILGCAAVLALSALPAQAARLALVIGNADYASMPDLRNARNDATDMAAKLKELGFTLVGGAPQINATSARMKLLMRQLAESAQPGDDVLFYFAGHGVGGDNDNYLVPVDDMEIRTRADVPDFAVPARSILSRLENRGSGVNILILDACRNNPLPGSRSADRGLSRMVAPVSSFIAYAASPGQTADDGEGRNGLFTGNLLKLMNEPGLRLDDMMGRVLEAVSAKKPGQEPLWESKLRSPFYFRPPGGGGAGPDPEIAFWRSTQSEGTAEAYEAYARKYPQGSFVELASMKLAALKRPASPGEGQQPAPPSSDARLLAVVPFAGPEEVAAQEVAARVEADLLQSGLFRALPRSAMPQRPSQPDGIDFDAWRALGVELLVVGQYNLLGDKTVVRFFLMDVRTGKPLLGFDLPATARTLRYSAHRVADLIFNKVVGIPGDFNTRLAFVSQQGQGSSKRYEVAISDADGHEPRTIATSREPINGPAWSPDRKRLAYIGTERGRENLYIQDLTTGAVNSAKLPGAGYPSAPAWSPDGRQLALALTSQGNADIHIYDMDTGNLRQLTEGPSRDGDPSWSPDGQTIAFTSDRSGSQQVHLVNSTGGDVSVLTRTGSNSQPAFAPDGKSLAVTHVEDGLSRIALVDLSGELRPLSSGTKDAEPSFSPNGQRILFTSYTDQRSELAMISVDGRARQRMHLPNDLREGAWSSLSP